MPTGIAAVASAGRPLPCGWADLLRQLVRGIADQGSRPAFANGREVTARERALHALIERRRLESTWLSGPI